MSPSAAPLRRFHFAGSSQTLLFDADDTLWENNIYFERAISGFIRMLAHPTLSPEQIHEEFSRLEQRRVQVHGYGTKSFTASLLEAYRYFKGRSCTSEDEVRIHELVREIVTARIELLPDVRETLRELAGRHLLILVTKGDREEQVEKLERSGLAPWFVHVEVVREKQREIYLDLRSHHRLDAATTWMIGNSPKSDINPALAAGLHAVFLPHPNTWVLEHETVHAAPEGQHLLVLNRFREMTEIF